MLEPQGLLGLPVKRPGRYKGRFYPNLPLLRWNKKEQAVSHGTVFGCQFHPEKSGETGLKILKNFGELNQ